MKIYHGCLCVIYCPLNLWDETIYSWISMANRYNMKCVIVTNDDQAIKTFQDCLPI